MNHQTVEFMARDRIADLRREAAQSQFGSVDDAADAPDGAPIRLLRRFVLRLQASHPRRRWSAHRTSS